METLTDLQKGMAATLIDHTLERIGGSTADLLIEEGELAKAVGQNNWKRSNVDDLNALSAFCDRMGYPPVPLLVVIPGLNKPEKSILIHSFKATLPTAEATKRWKTALEEIQSTPDDVWKAFRADVVEAEKE